MYLLLDQVQANVFSSLQEQWNHLTNHMMPETCCHVINDHSRQDLVHKHAKTVNLKQSEPFYLTAANELLC